jgi:hypothetical protein
LDGSLHLRATEEGGLEIRVVLPLANHGDPRNDARGAALETSDAQRGQAQATAGVEVGALATSTATEANDPR